MAAMQNKPPIIAAPVTLPGAMGRAIANGRAERSFEVQRAAIDEAARTATLAFASETPYERYWGIEILDCTAASMRLGRMGSGANLLCDHDQRDVVGVVESVEIGADRVGRAVVRFGKSARAEEVWQDVRDGIRRNVSVGYMIHKAQLVETVDGVETYRVTDWEPFEVSLVSVPADASVGVGRSMSEVEVSISVCVSDDEGEDPEDEMCDPATDPTCAADGADVATLSCNPNQEKNIMSDVQVTERNHATEISKLSAAIPGSAEQALKSIQAGHTLEQFQTEVLRAMEKKPVATPAIGMSGTEQKRYSVLRAIRAMVDKDWTGAGFERECHNAILKRNGMGESPNAGFFVPYEIQQRDLVAATPSVGGYLVATENLGGSFIDLLRNRAVVAKAGATFLTGLQGNVTIPKQTAASTAYWLTNEATAITESALTLGQLSLTPKNVGAYQEVSRQLLLQNSPSADALVMNDLARVLALAIDVAALEGSGASGQPTGITGAAGLGSVSGTSLGWAGIVEFQTDVAGSNALADKFAYITTPAVAGLLMARSRFTNTDTPIWEGALLDGKVGGFPAYSTMQLTAATMIAGDFSNVVIGEWGQLEIAMNPYANFAAAVTGIRAIQTVDVGVRWGAAFSRATSIT